MTELLQTNTLRILSGSLCTQVHMMSGMLVVLGTHKCFA